MRREGNTPAGVLKNRKAVRHQCVEPPLLLRENAGYVPGIKRIRFHHIFFAKPFSKLTGGGTQIIYSC